MPDLWSWEHVETLIPLLAEGLQVTVWATLGGTALALVLGLILAGLRGQSRRWLSMPTAWFIEFVRSTPLYVQLLLVWTALLPAIGLNAPPLLVGILCLGIHYACYMSEIYRAGHEALPGGQHEAAKALGRTPWQTFRHIIVPQAIPRAVPALGNRMIAMFKETPLLSAITVMEMLRVARAYNSEHFRNIEPYTLVGIYFLVISLAAALLVRLIEHPLPVRHP